MAGVGGYACDYVKGRIRVPGETVMVGRRPGIDGYSVHLAGLADSAFVVRVVLRDTEANIEAWYQNIAALRGTKVSIVNDWGRTYTNCRIVDVDWLDCSAYQLGATAGCRGELVIRGMKES